MGRRVASYGIDDEVVVVVVLETLSKGGSRRRTINAQCRSVDQLVKELGGNPVASAHLVTTKKVDLLNVE